MPARRIFSVKAQKEGKQAAQARGFLSMLFCGAEVIDMAEQLLDATADLMPFRPERLDLFGELRVGVLGFLECLLRGHEFLQCGFLLLTETVDERDRLLD